MRKLNNKTSQQIQEKKAPGRMFVQGIVCGLVLFYITTAHAAVENLDEAIARKARLAKATWSYSLLQNNSNNYTWQPETLNYTDTTSSNEVWQLTAPAVRNNTQDISITHWSANGNRVLFHSKRTTDAFTYANDSNTIWMLVNSDGSRLKPAKNAAAQLASVDAFALWSPILADTLYQGGGNDGQSTAMNGFYKVQVSDTTISKNLFLTVPGATRMQLKKAISGDGRKVVIKAETRLYPVTVFPEASKGFDTTNGYAMLLNFDYWATPITSWADYHDQFVAGAVNGADGVWNYIMPENSNGSWWRARLTGSGTNQAPFMTEDLTQPYNWGGELEPINSGGGGKNPWCPQGVVAGTDCMEYFSHFTPDRWGRYGISTKSNNAPYGTSIADLRKHTYKVNGFTPIKMGGVNAQWVQHHDWEAWSDWSASSAYPNVGNYLNGAIVSQNVNDSGSQKMIASTYTRYNGTSSPPYESLARPTQSPDGTKVMYNSTLLSATDSNIQLFWAVAYYPYPPEIKSAAKNGSKVRLTWDFNQGTAGSPNLSNPRTYATRGWPHETNDRPPSPREIDKFRVWVSPDNDTWSPLGTTNYNNCRGNNECGMWTETAWTYDVAQSADSTRYYALTSLEYSGLESRTLSNVWKVTLDKDGNIKQQNQQSKYPASPGGKSPFYTTPSPAIVAQFKHKQAPATAAGQYVVKWNAPVNAAMIRYYNIYAKDGSLPVTNATPLADRQKSRIASIPASSDYSGSGAFSYIDWLGATDGSTKYVVTAVDYQGNETRYVDVPAAPKNMKQVSP